MALDENIEAFVVHISSSSLGPKMKIHSSKTAEIVFLLAEKVTVLPKYLEFVDIFSQRIQRDTTKTYRIN